MMCATWYIIARLVAQIGVMFIFVKYLLFSSDLILTLILTHVRMLLLILLIVLMTTATTTMMMITTTTTKMVIKPMREMITMIY